MCICDESVLDIKQTLEDRQYTISIPSLRSGYSVVAILQHSIAEYGLLVRALHAILTYLFYIYSFNELINTYDRRVGRTGLPVCTVNSQKAQASIFF